MPAQLASLFFLIYVVKAGNTGLGCATLGPQGGGTADCPGKGVWENVGVGAAEGMSDRVGMTSVCSDGLGHCTHR